MSSNEIESGLDFQPQFNMVDPRLSGVNLAASVVQVADTNEVLNFGYVTRDAVAETLQSGHASFFDRERFALDSAGGNMANPFVVSDALVDCDQDAIIWRIKPPTIDDLAFGSSDMVPEDFEFNIVSPKKPDVQLAAAIAQNERTGEILMIAYATRESIGITMQKGMATFYSRNRGQWTKGETSGDFLEVKDMRFGKDSVIYMVEPKGAGACHTKKAGGKARESCFFRKVSNLPDLRGKKDDVISSARMQFLDGQE